VTFHGYNAQTETLFAAIVTASIGAAWWAWTQPRVRRFVVLGALCGLAVSTRRMGLVVPAAVVAVLVLDARLLLSDRPPGSRIDALRPHALLVVGLGAGIAIGLLPELLAGALHGGTVATYGRGNTLGHLSAVTSAATSPVVLLLFIQILLRHLAYLGMSTLGAPVLLLVVLVGLRGRSSLDRATHRTFVFVGALVLGLATLTTMHIVRWMVSHWGKTEWGLYPRYMDPMEQGLTLVGFAIAVHLWERKETSIRLILPFAALQLGLSVLAGPFARPRGGRLPNLNRLAAMGLDGLGQWSFVGLCVVVLGLCTLWWWKGRPASLATLVLTIVLTWTLSMHSWHRRVFDLTEYAPPAVLRMDALQAHPDAPLAVIVYKAGSRSRAYYEPAFRSDHPVSWVQRGEELDSWCAAHPDGFVLRRKRDRPGPKLPKRGQVKGWTVYATK
jgi:hypothetical protein